MGSINDRYIDSLKLNDEIMLENKYLRKGAGEMISEIKRLEKENKELDNMIEQLGKVVGDKHYISENVNINLTKTFGAGNEPTAERMEAILKLQKGWLE